MTLSWLPRLLTAASALKSNNREGGTTRNTVHSSQQQQQRQQQQQQQHHQRRYLQSGISNPMMMMPPDAQQETPNYENEIVEYSNENYDNEIVEYSNTNDPDDAAFQGEWGDSMTGGGGGGNDFGNGPDDYYDGPDEDYYYDDMILDFLTSYASQIQECGVDLTAFLPAADASDSGDFDPNPMALLEMFKLSKPCSSSQEEEMRKALLKFQDCAGYELLELDEVFLGSLSGVAVKCINSMTALDMATLNVPEDCAKALLGHHPLGNMIRDVLLHPAKFTQCLNDVSNTVPQCSIDLWPFPVDGKAVKQGTCILSKAEDIWTQMCQAGLQALDGCLAPSVAETTFSQCSVIQQQCPLSADPMALALTMLPATVAGMPLPDSCASQNPGVAERYDAYRATCTPQGKALWEQLEAAPKENEELLTPIHDFLHPPAHEQQPPDEEALVVSVPPNEQVESVHDVARDNDDDKKDNNSSGAGGTFGFGMLTGMVVAVVGYVGVAMFLHKRRGGKIGLPGHVELSTSGDFGKNDGNHDAENHANGYSDNGGGGVVA